MTIHFSRSSGEKRGSSARPWATKTALSKQAHMNNHCFQEGTPFVQFPRFSCAGCFCGPWALGPLMVTTLTLLRILSTNVRTFTERQKQTSRQWYNTFTWFLYLFFCYDRINIRNRINRSRLIQTGVYGRMLPFVEIRAPKSQRVYLGIRDCRFPSFKA